MTPHDAVDRVASGITQHCAVKRHEIRTALIEFGKEPRGKQIAHGVRIVVEKLLSLIEVELIGPQIVIGPLGRIAVPVSPSFPHQFDTALGGDHSRLSLLNKGAFKVKTHHRVEEEIRGAAQLLPEHGETLGVARGMLKKVAPNQSLVKGACRFGERHGEFCLYHGKIAHDPVMEGMPEFVSLLQHGCNRAHIA